MVPRNYTALRVLRRAATKNYSTESNYGRAHQNYKRAEQDMWKAEKEVRRAYQELRKAAAEENGNESDDKPQKNEQSHFFPEEANGILSMFTSFASMKGLETSDAYKMAKTAVEQSSTAFSVMWELIDEFKHAIEETFSKEDVKVILGELNDVAKEMFEDVARGRGNYKSASDVYWAVVKKCPRLTKRMISFRSELKKKTEKLDPDAKEFVNYVEKKVSTIQDADFNDVVQGIAEQYQKLSKKGKASLKEAIPFFNHLLENEKLQNLVKQIRGAVDK
jgi:chemotaxis regulatin CheY-phosphate phosphatase CheZ